MSGQKLFSSNQLAEILHHLMGSLSRELPVCIHPRWLAGVQPSTVVMLLFQSLSVSTALPDRQIQIPLGGGGGGRTGLEFTGRGAILRNASGSIFAANFANFFRVKFGVFW